MATEVEARLIGARVMRRPALDPGRSPGGKVVDVCGGGPCYAHGYAGP